MEFFLGAFENEWERRKAALLHDRMLDKERLDDEDERRRKAAAMSITGARRHGNSSYTGDHTARQVVQLTAERSMRARFASLASGSQPAVVKLASFGGRGRVRAMISYISRNGEIAVENERGEVQRGRDEISSVPDEWEQLMPSRRASRDIGTFQIKLSQSAVDGGGSTSTYEQVRTLLKRGLGARRFAFAIFPADVGGTITVEGVVVLRDRGGERLMADRAATQAVCQRWSDGDRQIEGTTSFRFTGRGNGADYGAVRLRDLVDRGGGLVQDERARSISTAKGATDLAQLEWRGDLHSRKPRDVMHLILSVRSGTDVAAFQASAADFLATQFPGHRYIVSIHDPALDPKAEEAGGKRPHVHAHAIVVMQSDSGQRIETTVASFRQWRVTMAEKAREHGIAMEMTDRRDRASAPAYRRSQVRPVSYEGRTEHMATSEAAHRRYTDKRGDQPYFAKSRQGRAFTQLARAEWMTVAREAEHPDVRKTAREQVARFAHHRGPDAKPQSVEKQLSQAGYQDSLAVLMETIQEKDMREMNREAFESYEHQVETALSAARRLVPDAERVAFEEIALSAREHVNARRVLLERQDPAGWGVRRDDHNDSHHATNARSEHDGAKQWHIAVARHGLETVDEANRVILEIEYYREQIEALQRKDVVGDRVVLRANLDLKLAHAGELGRVGNSLIREIGETDPELRVAIERAYQTRNDDRARDRRSDRPQVRDRGNDDR